MSSPSCQTFLGSTDWSLDSSACFVHVNVFRCFIQSLKQLVDGHLCVAGSKSCVSSFLTASRTRWSRTTCLTWSRRTEPWPSTSCCHWSVSSSVIGRSDRTVTCRPSCLFVFLIDGLNLPCVPGSAGPAEEQYRSPVQDEGHSERQVDITVMSSEWWHHLCPLLLLTFFIVCPAEYLIFFNHNIVSGINTWADADSQPLMMPLVLYALNRFSSKPQLKQMFDAPTRVICFCCRCVSVRWKVQTTRRNWSIRSSRTQETKVHLLRQHSLCLQTVPPVHIHRSTEAHQTDSKLNLPWSFT